MTILILILTWLKAYWLDMLIAAALITFLVWLWKRKNKPLAKKIIYALICRAEKAFGSKTGSIKQADVWAKIYSKLPFLIRIVFTRAELEGYIEDGVQALKKQLESGEVNLLSYDQEVQEYTAE